MKLSVIIPCYNEEKTIAEILEKVARADIGQVKKEIIVVDDGSGDKTAEIVLKKKKENTNIIFIRSKKNGGKGRAIRIGLKKAKGDIVIIQDADLEYDPNDYSKLIGPIIEGRTKVVYGSRMLNYKNRKKLYIMNWYGTIILTKLANLLYNAKITDEPTCYKVFSKEVIDSISLKCERFEFCPEVTAKVRKKGYKITEVPIFYKPRSFEEGKKINWKDGIEAVWTLLKYRFVD